MIRFTLRRLAAAIPILFGVSVVIFITLKITPGNPVDSLLGPNSTPFQRAEMTRALGLDKPIPIQFWDWFSRIVRGNFGESIAAQLPARPIVLHAFYNTMILTAFAAIVALVFGVLLGAIAAFRNGKIAGSISSAIGLFSVSAPQYSVALVLLVVFVADFHVFPGGGMYNAVTPGGLPDLLDHILLPGISAALVPMGIVARMFRSSLLETLSLDFVESYRARGLSKMRVNLHVFHNALPSLLTVAGLQIGYLLGGVVFVETIYSWPGLGQLVYLSISQRDLPVIQAGVLVSALAFVLLNVLVDVMHGVVDPRVRG